MMEMAMDGNGNTKINTVLVLFHYKIRKATGMDLEI